MAKKKPYKFFRDASPKQKERINKLASSGQKQRWHEYSLKHIEDSQHVLMATLCYRFGGRSVVAKMLNVPNFAVSNWCKLGVPVKQLSRVTAVLRVPKWGLNYRFFVKNKNLFPELPAWEKVIEQYGFSADEVKRLRKLGAPE